MTTDITFASLGLAEPLMRAIADVGYERPTPIQAQAIPVVLSGRDLLAAAQTGTGKTAGFTLPLLHRLAAARAKPGRPRCLILVPTRELAAQVQESVETYGKYLPLTSMVMFGGVNINPQISALKKPVDILVATPGRLLDHLGQKTLSLDAVEVLVLDEADRMLDMGFIRDIRKVLAVLPKQRQNLLYSATFSDEIRQLATGLLHNPASVEVARRNTATETVDQTVHLVPQAHKRDLLAHLIRQNDWHQVLVFTRTKHGANRLAEKLVKEDLPAAAIHGNKSQSARTKALAGFKDGSLRVLVATDIAARGIDIDQLPQVVNFELPNVPEDYVHRIGRTGRAGCTGKALSLVDREEMTYLRDIEKLIKRSIPRVEVEGFVPPAKSDSAEDERPPHPGGNRGRGGRAAPGGQPRGQGSGRAAQGRREGQPARAAGHGNTSGHPAPLAREGRQAPSRPQRAEGQRANAPRNPAPAPQGARPAAKPAQGRGVGGGAAAGNRPRSALFTPKSR